MTNYNTRGGDPLATLDCDGDYTQLGVLSQGSIYCEIGLPNLYTKVTSYMDWIRNVTGENFLSSFIKIRTFEDGRWEHHGHHPPGGSYPPHGGPHGGSYPPYGGPHGGPHGGPNPPPGDRNPPPGGPYSPPGELPTEPSGGEATTILV